MRKLIFRIATEGAIVAMALLLVVFATKIVGLATTGNSRNPPDQQVDAAAALIGKKTNAKVSAARRLLIVTNKDCRFCQLSAIFHAEIAKSSNRQNVLFYVPNLTSQREWLARIDHNIAGNDLSELGVRVAGTPTILGLDEHSVIVKVWVGKLNSNQEEEVLQFITRDAPRADTARGNFSVVSSVNLANEKPAYRFVDLRSRDNFRLSHTRGAINVPEDEVAMRAQEFTGQRIALDCIAQTMAGCVSAAQAFQKAGASSVILVDVVKYPARCGPKS